MRYRIPKGAAVIPNAWSVDLTSQCICPRRDNYFRQMSRDPDVYRNPSSLMPERFLGEIPELDPYVVSFGFGRRQVVSCNYIDLVSY